MKKNEIILGDCIEVMKGFEDNCIDSIVTDPPYGIGFMGKDWDTFKNDYINKKYDSDRKIAPGRNTPSFQRSSIAGSYDYSRNKEFQQWFTIFSKECLRILKPGGHLLSFGGTRTYHRMVCAIEDAGFEIRDCLQWIYGSGFPKNLDISKQIDKIDTSEFKEQVSSVIKEARNKRGYTMDELCNILELNNKGHGGMINHYENKRATPTLELWKRICKILEINDLKNYEIIKKGRTKIIGKIENPISWFGEGIKKISTTPEAKQWDGFGTALKPANEPIVLARKPIFEKNIAENVLKWGTGGINIDGCRIGTEKIKTYGKRDGIGNSLEWSKYKSDKNWQGNIHKGRWPANVIFDEEAAELLDEQSGQLDQCGGEKRITHDKGMFGIGQPGKIYKERYRGASRFFYIAKASKAERNAGLEGFEKKNKIGFNASEREYDNKIHKEIALKNNHPTVKPIKLMRYLVRLITPPGGICLDPFIGSGTTAIACIEEGFDYIGIEKEKEYFDIAEKRIFHYKRQLKLF